MSWYRKFRYLIPLVLILVFGAWQVSLQPTNNRNWNVDQQILPYAEINKNLVTIHNVRNFRFHSSEDDFTPGYYDKTYDLNKIKKVYFVVENFSAIEAQAHTFLTFEFEDNTFVAITVESRNIQGRSWNPISGLFKQYELMYVIADERDVLELRTNVRKDPVYLYPIKADKAAIAELFTDMVNRANDLRNHPAFYNTLTDSCTTTIVKHVNKIAPNKIPLSWKFILPGYAGDLAYQVGLIDTNLPLSQAKQKYMITQKAQAYGDGPDFSEVIRAGF